MTGNDRKYQIISRKFRPQTFASVVGQEPIVATLKNAIKFKRVAHAYLFCGLRGTGKTTLARIFAKALNCRALTADGEPCNECASCQEITSGRSLDVLEIDGASNRGIDDIRQLNETVGYAPASGQYKIYIIDEVHMLTKEAFNALLKTLEEPPPNVKFFFATTEPHKVLPTIISRCQRFDLHRISSEAMISKLSSISEELQVKAEEEALELIAHLSEGSLRDAESLFDQLICTCTSPLTAEHVRETLGMMPKAVFFELDQAIHSHNLSYAFELTEKLSTSGKDLSYFIDGLINHFRTLLLLKLQKQCPALSKRELRQYQDSLPLYSEEQCLYLADYLINWSQQFGKMPFKRVGMEMLLLHLIKSRHRVRIETLVRKLSELEQTRAPAVEPPKEEAIAKLPAREKSTLLKNPEADSANNSSGSLEKAAASFTIASETKADPAFEKLTNTLQEKIQAVEAPAVVEEKKAPSPQPPEAPVDKNKLEILLRFTAVELEGSVKKNKT